MFDALSEYKKRQENIERELAKNNKQATDPTYERRLQQAARVKIEQDNAVKKQKEITDLQSRMDASQAEKDFLLNTTKALSRLPREPVKTQPANAGDILFDAAFKAANSDKFNPFEYAKKETEKNNFILNERKNAPFNPISLAPIKAENPYADEKIDDYNLSSQSSNVIADKLRKAESIDPEKLKSMPDNEAEASLKATIDDIKEQLKTNPDNTELQYELERLTSNYERMKFSRYVENPTRKGNIAKYKVALRQAQNREDFEKMTAFANPDSKDYDSEWKTTAQKKDYFTDKITDLSIIPKYATVDERNYYNYLYNKFGKEKAEEYYKVLEYYLGQRQAQSYSELVDDANPFMKTVYSAASIPLNVVGNVTAFVDDTVREITDGRINPYSPWQLPRNAASIIRSETAQDIKEATGSEILSQSYQAVLSGADSFAGAFLFGQAYLPIMGMGAAANRAAELYEAGATNSQIVLGSFASGLAEVITEKMPFDRLLQSKNAKGLINSLKALGATAATEALEETSSDIINEFIDALNRGSESDRNTSIREYMEYEGLSYDQAKRKAERDFVEQALWSAYGGAISGGGAAVLNIGAGHIANRQSRPQNYKTSDNGRTYAMVDIQEDNASEANKAEVKTIPKNTEIKISESAPIAEVKNGKIKVATENGGTVAADKVSFGDAKLAKALDTVKAMLPNVNADDANTLVNAMITIETESDEDFTQKAQAIAIAYDLGVNGESIEALNEVYAFNDTEGAEAVIPMDIAEAAFEIGAERFDANVIKQSNMQTEAVSPYKSREEAIAETRKATNADETLSDEQRLAAQATDKLGTAVEYYDSTERFGTNKVNGYIDNYGVIHIAKNNTHPLRTVLMHELTHYGESSESYNRFVKTVESSKAFEKWLRSNVETMIAAGIDVKVDSDIGKLKNAYKDYITKLYGKNNVNFNMRNEMIANFAEDNFYNDKNGLSRFVESLSEPERKTVLDYIKSFISWAKQKLSGKAKEIAELERQFNEIVRTVNASEAGNAQFSYAGENSRFANEENLSKAKKMEKDGKASEEIRKATGWFRGYDNKWRYEIDNSKMKWNENPKFILHTDDDMTYRTIKLDKLISHDDLFSAYPQLANITVAVQPMELGTRGNYSPSSNSIALSNTLFEVKTKGYSEFLDGDSRRARIKEIENTSEYKEYNKFYNDDEYGGLDPTEWLKLEKEARDNFFASELGKEYYSLKWGDKAKFNGQKYEFGMTDNGKKTLLHEIQHAIQTIEGFAGGSTPDYWNRRINRGYDTRIESIKAEERKLIDEAYKIQSANKNLYSDAYELYKLEQSIDDNETNELIGDISNRTNYERMLSAMQKKYGQDKFNDTLLLIKKLSYLSLSGKRTAEELYEMTAGEIEARDVSARADFSTEQRKNTRPDIDRTNVVFTDNYNKNSGTAQFSIDEDINEITDIDKLRSITRTLQRQNAEQVRKINRLERETKVTSYPVIDEAFVKSYTREIIDRIGATVDSNADISGNLSDIANKLKKSLYDKNLSNDAKLSLWNEAEKDAAKLSNELVSSAKELTNAEDFKTYKKLRSELKKLELRISPEDTKNIDGFSKFANRNRKYFAKLIISDKANIDSTYTSLQNEYGPDLFPNMNTPSEQLEQIINTLDSLNSVYDNPYSANMNAAVDYYASEIVGSLMNGKNAAPTYADKATEAIKAIRADRDAKIEAIKAHNREVEQVKSETKYDREQRQKLLKIVQKLKNKRTTRDRSEFIKELIKDIDTVAVGMTGQKIEDATDLELWWDNNVAHGEKDEFDLSPATRRRIARLGKRRIADMTLEEVEELTKVLLNVQTVFSSYDKLIDSQNKRSVFLSGLQVREDVHNSNVLFNTDENGSKVSFKEKISKRLFRYNADALTAERLIHRITGYNDDDPLYIAAKELSAGQRKQLDFQRRAYGMVKEFTSDKKFMQSISGPKANMIKLTGYDNTGEIRTYYISPAMRMSLYLHMKNESNRRHILSDSIKYRGGGITIPSRSAYLDGSDSMYKNASTIRMSASDIYDIIGKMTPKEKMFADRIDSFFNGMAKNEINDVSEKLVGYAIASVKGYFPIATDSNYRNADFDTLKFDGTLEGNGSLKSRTNGTNPILLIDVNEVLDRAIKFDSKYVGLAVPMRNFNAIYQSQAKGYEESTKATIERAYGNVPGKYIEKLFQDLNGVKQRQDNAIMRFISKITSGYAAGVLELNISVAIKQAASYFTAAAVVGYKPLFKGLVGKVDIEAIAERTPLLWYRSLGYSSNELGDLVDTSGNLPKALKWINAADVKTTTRLWRVAEEYCKSEYKNLSGQEFENKVTEIYNRIIEETQPNYTIMQRPGLLRSNEYIVRQLNMFKTQPLQNLNIVYDAVNNFYAKKKLAKLNPSNQEVQAEFAEAKKYAGRAITSQVVSSFVLALMQFTWALFTGNDDRYRDKKTGKYTFWSWSGGILFNMLTNGIGMFPYGSVLYEAIGYIVDSVTEKYGMTIFDSYFDGIELSPLTALSDTILDFGKLLGQISGNFAEEDGWNKENFEATMRKLYNFGTNVSTTQGIPIKNVVNLMKATTKRVMQIVSSGKGNKYLGEYMSLRLEKEPMKNKNKYYDILYKAYRERNNNYDNYQKLYDLMIKDGFTADELNNAMRNRGKDPVENEKISYDTFDYFGRKKGSKENAREKSDYDYAQKIIDELQDESGEGAAPSKAEKSFTVDNKKVELDNLQFTRYATDKGTYSLEYLIEFSKRPEYKELTADEKISIVKNLYSYANQIAKSNATDEYILEQNNKGLSEVLSMPGDNTKNVVDYAIDKFKDGKFQKQTKEYTESYISLLRQNDIDGAKKVFNSSYKVMIEEYKADGIDEKEAVQKTLKKFQKALTDEYKPIITEASQNADYNTKNKIKSLLQELAVFGNYSKTRDVIDSWWDDARKK